METPSGQYVKRRVGLPSIYSPGIAAQWYATAKKRYDLPIASMMDFEASFMTFRARETNHIKFSHHLQGPMRTELTSGISSQERRIISEVQPPSNCVE